MSWRVRASIVLLACGLLAGPAPLLAQEGKGASPRVYFSPNGGATDAVIGEIEKAHTFILIQMYTFTSAPLAEALRDAVRRGVKVLVILDKSQQTERYSSAAFLARAGIKVWIDSQHPIAHSKVMLVDGETVVSGSFNFTKTAESGNAENLLILKDRRLALLYQANWEEHLGHSGVYSGR